MEKEFKSSRKNTTGSKRNVKDSLVSSVKLIGTSFSSWFKGFMAKRKVPGAPKSFKLNKIERTKSIEKSSKIIADSFRFIRSNWKTLSIILLVYTVSYFVLAYATPNIDLPEVVKQANDAGAQPGTVDKLKTFSSALFTYRGDASDFSRWAQFFLAIIFSLIFIYAIRNMHQGIKLRARDALYSGTGNLIPFFMNISLIAIQLIPFTLLSVIYNIGMARDLFVNNLEKFVAGTILVISGLLTFWFIPTAIISLYAITVPGVYPSKTMEAVRIIVSRRRLEVVRHLLVFVLFVLVSYLVLLLLLVTYVPRFANLSLDLFFLIALPVIHVMMFKLYLKLLDGSSEAEA
jgi:hypothetical protein